MSRWAITLVLLTAGCAGGFSLRGPHPDAVAILRESIHKEFDRLVKDFDAEDGKGNIELCAPTPFAIARFATYQTLQEKDTPDLAQLTRFITRARRALKAAQTQRQNNQCVDSDGDGLTDLAEVRIHNTNPQKADTDGDGLTDGEEVLRYRTNPLKYDGDGDLLRDGEEVKFLRTDPHNPDTDGDGYTDGIEVALGSDPLDPCSFPPKGERRPGPWRKCTTGHRPPRSGKVIPDVFRREILIRGRIAPPGLKMPHEGKSGGAPPPP
ncbi:MAG: hypothetical protein O2807_03160 [bacterium]|nr:hypothetical protein [bacterium]